MRKSPGVVTEALMHASATDDEKVEDAKCKEVRLQEASTAKVDAKLVRSGTWRAKDKLQAKKSETEDAADVELTVGDIVVVNVSKDKARFDNCAAEVLRLGKTDKVRVKMLDGPAAGVSKDFPRSCLKLPPVPESTVPETSVPAEDDQETKRRKMAADLFGTTL
jgi:hypothetical protein